MLFALGCLPARAGVVSPVINTLSFAARLGAAKHAIARGGGCAGRDDIVLCLKALDGGFGQCAKVAGDRAFGVEAGLFLSTLGVLVTSPPSEPLYRRCENDPVHALGSTVAGEWSYDCFRFSSCFCVINSFNFFLVRMPSESIAGDCRRAG